MFPIQLFDSRFELALSDERFTVFASRNRLENVKNNFQTFGLLSEDFYIFEDCTMDFIRESILSGPTLFSVSGASSLLPYIPELNSSPALISEFLGWKYISSFTPLDFYPPVSWREILPLVETNDVKTLLTSGYAELLLDLRFSASDNSIESLLAFETSCALTLRLKIPRKVPSFYQNSTVYLRPGDVVIDCGACASSFGGQFVTEFAELVSPNGKVIAFEPISEVFEALERDTKHHFNIALINAAVWNRHTMLEFASDGISSRKLSAPGAGAVGTSHSVSVRAETIDAVAMDTRVNFIKMDIEGSEYEALLGAETTLRRDTPDLSICLYHSPEDFLRIPQLIKSLCPEYKLWLELNEGHVWSGMKLLGTARG